MQIAYTRNIYRDLGREMSLSRAILHSDMTYRYISSVLGITEWQLYEYIINPSCVTINQAIILCELLDVSINEIEWTH